MVSLPVLPASRLELQFAESKPAYTEAEAVTEATRCLYCADAPCIKACPTEIDIPTFIHKIATGNVKGAARTIFDSNILGDSCARVCPVEVLCAGDCVYNAWGRPPIQIGRLQRFATQTTLATTPLAKLYTPKPSTGKKVAIIGAGPASVAAAGLLALEGHKAVLFEKRAIPGGLNALGIAPYKMLGDVALAEMQQVFALGDVELRTGIELVPGTAGAGQVSAEELLKTYDAVFLGLGLGADSKLGVAAEAGYGVWGAVDLIEHIKSDGDLKLEGVQRALVVGGGNTAIDIAHELALLGVPDVVMVYRRDRNAMPGYVHEMDYARKHSVRLLENAVVTSFERDDRGGLMGARIAKAVDGKAVAGSEEFLSAQVVALAIGQNRATDVAKAFAGVELDKKGRVVVDPQTHRTGNAKVWSGGDCVNGGKEVVNAVAEAKIAVRDILRALAGA